MTLAHQSPVVLAGHSMSFGPQPGVVVVPRKPVPGGFRLWCACGWERPEPAKTKREVRGLYLAEHLGPLRLEARTTCRVCCEVKHPGQMAKAKGAGNICKRCLSAKTRAWAAQNPTRWNSARWRSHLQRYYGITVEQYDELLVKQGGRCAICRTLSTDSPRRFHVDHDHKSGLVRGLLCYRCNTGIGVFLDDPNRLRAAIRYLKEHGACSL